MTEKNLSMQEKKKDCYKKPKINEKNGLNISYDKNELRQFYPHLIAEISDKKKSIKIDSVKMEDEEKKKISSASQNRDVPEELINPRAVDFIRRCKTDGEAREILDFLLKRKEITIEEYNELRNHIKKEGGLKKLTDECGGFKKPGYYEMKYYQKK